MGAIPVVIEVDGEEIYTEANPNESLLEVAARVVPPEKWEESIVSTPAGNNVDPNKTVRELVRETGETRFKVLSAGDQGVIPGFPNFLRDVKVKDSDWYKREREEVIRIKMLNNTIANYNPGFGYVNPVFLNYESYKVIKGWATANCFGSVEFIIFLPLNYPSVPPEATLYGRFFNEYMRSNIHRHTYDFSVGEKRIPVICGDRDFIYKWTGRFGVAHYISSVLFPWIHLESMVLARKKGIPVSIKQHRHIDIIDILRGD